MGWSIDESIMQKSELSHTRFLFFGTPAFAVPALQALHKTGAPLLCVTNPDKPSGRKNLLTASPVKLAALQCAIRIVQPQRLDNLFLEELRSFQPDIAVLAAYGKIITPVILSVPKHGFVNIHPSLLPKYRGASPVVASILAGDKETGVTIMKMDERLDHGPILDQRILPLDGSETMGTLTEKLGFLGATLLFDVLPRYLGDRLVPIPQNEHMVSMTHMVRKEDARIDWNNDAADIERQVRAYHPWPVAWTRFNNRLLLLHRSRVAAQHHKGFPGTLVVEGNHLMVHCGNATTIELLSVQLEGKRRMSAAEFVNGNARHIPTTLE